MKGNREEERLAALVRDSADGIVVVDCHGVVLFANPAAETLLGREADGAIGYHLGLPAIGDTPPLLTLRRLDGPPSVVEIRAKPTRWDGNDCWVINLHDRTEQHDASERLHFQARMLAAVGEAVTVTDPNGRIRFWNASAERLYGWRSEEVLGRQVTDVLASDGLGESVHGVMAQLRDGERWSSELRVRRRDGNVLPIRASVTPVHDARGRLDAIIGISSDLTEIHHAHDAYRRSVKRLRDTVENILDGFISLDQNLEITYFNSAAEQIFRKKRRQVLGRPLFDVLPEARDWLSPVRYSRLMRSKKTRTFEIRVEAPPVENWYQVNAYPGVHGVSLFFGLTTDRKRMEEERRLLEEQLNQAQKMDSIGRLAGGVAHDFNNVLQAITGYGEILYRRLAGQKSVSEYVEQILKGARRAAELTQQLLGFARKQAISPRILDLNEAVEGMLKMLRRLIREDLALEWQPAGRLPSVRVDPVQIDQILVNLVVNARDAIEGVGAIRIKTYAAAVASETISKHPEAAAGDYVVLAVQDDGTGIEANMVNKIFEPFYTTKAHGEGTGLGLATVYGIVKQNGGFVDVETEVGAGTTFRVYLPTSVHGDDEGQAVTDETRILEGDETVLVVEDDESIGMLARAILENLGYTVLSAQTPSAALCLAAGYTGEIHLLLTDVVMPEMDGRELLGRIEESRPEIKCLFMSGYAEDIITHRGVLIENVHFLQKPFSAQRLSIRLREALDSREEPPG